MSVQQEKFKAIADKIREKTGTEDLIKPNDFVNKIDDVYEAGIEAGKKNFMAIYQDYGNRETYDSAFIYWDESLFYPEYDIQPKTASSIFQNFNNMKSTNQSINLIERLNECGKKLDFSNTTGVLSYIFTRAKFSHIPLLDFRKASNLNASFLRSVVVYIEKIMVDEGNTYSNSFDYCENLAEVRFSGVIASSISLGWSPLSKESIKNIYETLSTTKTGQTLTLNKTAVNTAFGIDVDNETTFPEGSEYYNIRHSRDNWNVVYAE
jgi:hypothetical protein